MSSPHHDPQVIAACINAFAIVVAAIVTAMTASLIGKKISGRQKLVSQLELAKQDIQFLLQVEQRHGELHKANSGEPNLRRVRRHVKESTGLRWSGQFTPGRQPPREGE